MTGKLQNKIAIITGASGSIGSAISKRFALEGAKLILIARNITQLKILDNNIKEIGGEAMLVPLDLQNFDSIKNLSLSIGAKFKAVDILISNAAIIGKLNPIQDYDYDMWKNIMDVNFNANWHLIKNFDPLLKLSETGGRAIFVTSEVTQSPSSYPYWGPYTASKAALEAMVKIYAAETKHNKLCINMVYPGQVNSNIHNLAFPGQDPSLLATPEELTDKFVELSSDDCDVTGQSFKLSSTLI